VHIAQNNISMDQFSFDIPNKKSILLFLLLFYKQKKIHCYEPTQTVSTKKSFIIIILKNSKVVIFMQYPELCHVRIYGTCHNFVILSY